MPGSFVHAVRHCKRCLFASLPLALLLVIRLESAGRATHRMGRSCVVPVEGRAVYSRIMKPISFGRALNYPYIFPQDRRWLRTAALYHDGLARIVPKNFMATEYDRHGSIDILRDLRKWIRVS